MTVKSSKRILVTGGAGFIGLNLVNKLCAKSNDCIYVLDNDVARLESVQPSHILKPVFLDCSDINAMIDFFEVTKIDTVIHLAANSDIKNSSTNSTLDFKNTLQTSVVLSEMVLKYQIKKFIFASSSAIFGQQPGPIPCDDDLVLHKPISNYGWAKLASERVLEMATTQKHIPLIVLRFPNIVGKGATHGVVFDLLNKLRINPNRLEVLGNGSQEKPYVHVEDLVNIIDDFVYNVDYPLKVNISGETCLTVKQIVNVILSETRLEPLINWGSEDYGWKGDVSKYSFQKDSKIYWKKFFIRDSESAIRDAVNELW